MMMNNTLKAFLLSMLLVVTVLSSCKKTDEPVVTTTPPPPVIPPPVTPPPTTTVTDYYVSANTGSNSNDGLTPNTPFATIAKGTAMVSAGGTVHIMNGTYVQSTYGALIDVTKSGTATGYITYKAYTGHNPVLTAYGGSWNAVSIEGSYIIVDGLELVGSNNINTVDTDSANAKQAYDTYYVTKTNPQSVYNTNAVTIGQKTKIHHVTVKNCKIHDFPGGGVSAFKTDYITIEGNTIYNNCWYMMYGGSGISILHPEHFDTNTGYKMFIRNNIVYNNHCKIPWEAVNKLSDGNGIIIDVNQTFSSTKNGVTTINPAYIGRTLVENNVSFYNGGGGIHGYRAEHLDIINNTAFNNGRKVGYPEIDGQSGVDVKIYNNIMYARTGRSELSTDLGRCNGNDIAEYKNNIYFNGTFFKASTAPNTSNTNANPLFVNLSNNGSVANFSLQWSSLAINGGNSILFAPKDILGAARPKGTAVDCGAYEVN